MKQTLYKLFNIRKGEAGKVLLMFFYLFFIIATLLIIKPVRNSLFLTYLGIARLPTAYIFVAVAAVIFTNIYTVFSSRVRLDRLIYYTLGLAVVTLLCFWILLSREYRGDWFFYLLYIWVALFGVLTTSQFWLMANYVFNAREAKRLFGLISAGGILGGIFGGYSANLLAALLQTHNLLFLCVVFLIVDMILMTKIWKISARENYNEKIQQQNRLKKHLSGQHPWRFFGASKHFTYIAALVGVSVLVSNLVDYQFNDIASRVFTNRDQLTAFFGFWLSNLSLLSLLIQLFITGRFLGRFGVTSSLFLLPFGILIGAVTTLLNPSKWPAVFIKLADGSLKQSINKAGFELLALPLPTEIKNRGKAVIDVLVDSVATGTCGILLVFFTRYSKFSPGHISYLIFVFISLWFFLIIRDRRHYVESFRSALEKRSIDIEDQNISIHDASIYKSLIQFLSGKNKRQILYVLSLIENIQREEFLPHLISLLDFPSVDVKIKALQILGKYKETDISERIRELVYHENFDVQVEALSYLHGRNKSHNFFKEFFWSGDYSIKSAALVCAAKEYNANADIRDEMDFENIYFEHVNFFKKSTKPHEFLFGKVIQATVIGIAKVDFLYSHLVELLKDNDTTVLEAAVISAGQTGNEIFIPILVQHLATKRVRRAARNALAEYGDRVVDKLEVYLTDKNIQRRIRLGLPRVLARVGSQRSIHVLLHHLEENDLVIRSEIIQALVRLKSDFPFLAFDEALICRYIIKRTKFYIKVSDILLHQKQYYSRLTEKENKDTVLAAALFIKALRERLDDTLDNIFRLLGLIYPSRDIMNVYQAIIGRRPDLKAHAIEYLENLLSNELKKHLLPIVEETMDDSTDPHQTDRRENDTAVLKSILLENDNWLNACALFFIAETRNENYMDMTAQFCHNPDPIVHETAVYALEKLKKNLNTGQYHADHH